MKRLRSTFSVQFYCRKSKVKSGQAPIECGVNIDGERFFYNLPRKGNPKNFLKTEGNYLRAVETKLREYELECWSEGEVMTVSGIKEYIRNGYSKPGKTIGRLVDDFYKHLEARVNTGVLADSGLNKYKTAVSLFIKDMDKDKPVSCITPGMIDDFCMVVDTKYEASTGIGVKTKVKALLSFAVSNNYIKVNPWQTKISKKVKKVEVPTEEEFEKIRNLDISYNRSLEQVRDLWVFASGSGLAYCDCASLKQEDFKEDKGIYYIKKQRRKTGVEFFSVLLPWAVDIAKKYNFSIPVISNQKVNCYLKTVGDLCGVSIPLHFHLARHLYCHKLLNQYKMSYQVAAKMMGHSQIKMTMHYGQMWDSTVLDEFRMQTSR